MHFLSKITIAFIAVMCVACQELPNYFVDDTTVARVGRKELRMSDLEQAIPQTLSGTDSVNMVGAYIDRWIAKQLKLEEAELIFSASAGDIEQKVEEYRQSLLIHKIEQYYIDNEPTTIVTDEDIEAWRQYLPSMPKGWICGYDEAMTLTHNRLYDLKAIPSLYLLDRRKHVLIKDGVSIEHVVSIISQGIQL